MNAQRWTSLLQDDGYADLQGREFTEQDQEKTEQVAVVNETFVRRLMPELQNAC